jgi:hypothetical protein
VTNFSLFVGNKQYLLGAYSNLCANAESNKWYLQNEKKSIINKDCCCAVVIGNLNFYEKI